MTIDLEKIQAMWEEDAKIDIDNLHQESLKTPLLHAKYFDIFNTIQLLRKKAEQQRKRIRFDRYEYFSGKADPEVYIENPFPKKIRDKETLQNYIETDQKLSEVTLKIEYYDIALTYLEEIIKQLHQRNYQIKNSIDFIKFSSGLG